MTSSSRRCSWWHSSSRSSSRKPTWRTQSSSRMRSALSWPTTNSGCTSTRTAKVRVAHRAYTCTRWMLVECSVVSDYVPPLRPAKRKVKRADEEHLQRLREVRLKEMQMFDILREILLYVLFLWVLLVISYGFRSAYFLCTFTCNKHQCYYDIFEDDDVII